MSDSRSTKAGKEQPRNDLGEIRGIGPKCVEALPKLGIGNCAELAQYLAQHSAESLSEELAKLDVQVAAKKILTEDWLGNARKQAGLREDAEPSLHAESSGASKEGDGAPNRHTNLPEEVRFGVIFWRENGDWRVTTYDERLPIKYDEQHGPDPEEWAAWILNKMKPDLEMEPAPTDKQYTAIADFEIDILDVQQSEAERFKKLAAEVSFEVSGAQAETLVGHHTPAWIQLQTNDLATNQLTCVALARIDLEPEVFTYREKLEYPIPEVGRYELHSLVAILPSDRGTAQHKGPVFSVVP